MFGIKLKMIIGLFYSAQQKSEQNFLKTPFVGSSHQLLLSLVGEVLCRKKQLDATLKRQYHHDQQGMESWC